MKQESIEAVGAKVAAGVTYAGSGGAVLAGLTLTEWGVIVGIITAIVGLVMQAIFGWRREAREQRDISRLDTGFPRDVTWPDAS